MIVNNNMNVNNHFRELFNDDNRSRFKIVYGGAGSGKSYSVAQKIVLDFLSKYGLNTLILRKVHRTNRISTFPLILKLLTGFENIISVNQSNMTITNLHNGNIILFNGLDNSEKIKSITFKNGILNTIWVEESSECSKQDIMQLSLRLRGESRWQFQIILTFNPISEHHWIKKHFFDCQVNINYWIHHSTYLNNPFIDKEYKLSMQELRTTDLNYYNIYALGNWGTLSGKIFNNYSIQDFDINSFDNYFIGLDFGTNDPTAIILIAKQDKNLYICKTHKQVGLLNYQIDKILHDDFNYGTTIIADCAASNQINELKLLGNNIIPCSKGVDSIVSGIKWLQQYNLIVHNNCLELIKELDTYVWRKDKNDNAIDSPVDINNHLIDALRYGCQFWRNESSIKIEFTPVDGFGSSNYW